MHRGTCNGQTVAVKVGKDSLSEKEKRHLLREGRKLKQFKHQNIVEFIGIVVQKKSFMILMEFMAGK